MIKPNLKSILGAANIVSALTNIQATMTKKTKKSKPASGVDFKVHDKTNGQSSMSHGTGSKMYQGGV